MHTQPHLQTGESSADRHEEFRAAGTEERRPYSSGKNVFPVAASAVSRSSKLLGPPDSSGQLNIAGEQGDTLGVNGAEVGVTE